MKLPINQIKLNPDNPRIIKDDKFKKLVQSIKEFPEMADIRPVVINMDNIILGGNMRFRAMKDKEKEFVIKDNVSGGEWDWDLLANEWNTEDLEAWGLDVPDFNTEDKELEDLSLKTNFEIVIECENEIEQEETYDKLSELGYKCKVLTL